MSVVLYLVKQTRVASCKIALFRVQKKSLYYLFLDLGAQCSMELRNYAGVLQWCDEGLKLLPTDKKLQELRATADKLKVDIFMLTYSAFIALRLKDVRIKLCVMCN